MRLLGFFAMMLFFLPHSPDAGLCGLKNTAFRESESISYKVFYSLAGVYIEAGIVTFSCSLEPFAGKTTYHLLATGKTLLTTTFIRSVINMKVISTPEPFSPLSSSGTCMTELPKNMKISVLTAKQIRQLQAVVYIRFR